MSAGISAAQVYTGETKPEKAALDTAMGALGTWGGPKGAVAAGAYFVIDKTIGLEEFSRGLGAIRQPITARQMLNPRLGPEKCSVRR